jgi:tripartite-type tricarboxylate transporter receptor subunit TctC
MMQALNDPNLRQRFYEQGVMAAPLTPEEFTAFIRAETARWDKVVRETGTKVE